MLPCGDVTASSAPETTTDAGPSTGGQISYKDTLNLLQTPFAMRANAKVREPEIQAFWAEQRIYERLSGRCRFGPHPALAAAPLGLGRALQGTQQAGAGGGDHRQQAA